MARRLKVDLIPETMKSLTLAFFFSCFIGSLSAQENCYDGIDNDADGNIDFNDTECVCDGFGGISSVTSLIPNPSFEDYSCCPSSVSMLYCSDFWMQASIATSDYFNLCGYTGIFNSADTPLPGAPGDAGYGGFYSANNWEENLGNCLLSPMLAGTDYTLNFWLAWSYGSLTLDVTLFGTTTCTDLPWATDDCPIGSGSWMTLGTTNITFPSDQSWHNVSINFTPTVDIYAISIGGPCGGQTPSGYNYYFIDELTLAATSDFGAGDITESGNWCNADLLLTANSDTTGGTWQWFMGDVALAGETGSTLDVMPYGPGDFSAVYTIGAECLKLDYTVSIPNAPVADFTFANECPGIAVPFTDASTITSGALIGWDWDFGDGGTSTLQNPTHVFTSSGTYTVSLTVTSDLGCTHTLTQDITIYPEPVADISTTDVCFNETSMFADASTITSGTVTGWGWDFGDGGTSTIAGPTNLYGGTGAYNVTLTVTSDMGCTDAITEVHNVTPQPVADFTFANACEGMPAAFDDISTVAGGTITGWSWDFGDGSTSTIEDPSHTFATAGTYNVQLIANAGSAVCADTIILVITAFPSPSASFVTANVCLNDPAIFTDGSTIVAPEILTTWAWDFDDATTSGLTSPTHSYTTAGTYNVSLTVTSGNGCIDNVIIPVTIYPLPNADFNHTTVCENQPPTVFTDNTSTAAGAISSWTWDFGDGSTASSSNPSHNYGTSGGFNVELTVATVNGCVDSVTIPVNVYEKPTAAFTSGNPIICNPGCVSFTDISTSPSVGIATQTWDFETGTTSSGAAPSACYDHGFGTEQFYDVTLVVKNTLGCYDTLYVDNYVTVVPTPIASFSFQPAIITIENTEVTFTNSSVMASSYLWDFGDGSPFSTVEDPIHTYPEIQKDYLVELEAYSANGVCKDSMLALVIIKDVIIFYVPNIFSPDGDSYNETFLPVFYSGFDPYDYHMTIFNRWGEIVFESYSTTGGWSGTYGDRGIVEDGTYIWQIEFKETMSDKRHKHRGHVTILK